MNDIIAWDLDFRSAYNIFNEDEWTSDGFYKNNRYVNQCWKMENNNRRETGKYFRINLLWILILKS